VGWGAVMGVKNLKAFALLGEQPRRIADPATLRTEVKALSKQLMAWPTSIAFRKHGTPAGIGGHNAAGMYPVRNFQEGYSDEELIERVTGETMTATILVKGKGCVGCPVRCHRVVKVEASDSPYGAVDPKWGGPEFETIGLWGPNLGVYDLNYIAQVSALCNQFGLDAIGTGTTIGIAMEAFQRGMITTGDTGGMKLEWGDPFIVLELLEQIAFKTRFWSGPGRGAVGPFGALAGYGSVQPAREGAPLPGTHAAREGGTWPLVRHLQPGGLSPARHARHDR